MAFAEWITDYDMHTDSTYKRPGCPKCYAPVGDGEGNGKYICLSCRKEYELTPEMEAWIREREGTRTEIRDCLSCGSKGAVEMHFRKNPKTLQWQTMGGKCRRCGMKFVV